MKDYIKEELKEISIIGDPQVEILNIDMYNRDNWTKDRNNLQSTKRKILGIRTMYKATRF